jgi:hypothetical protein
MVFVALVALNLGATRAFLNLRSPLNYKTIGVLGLGALPLVNFLAVGILVARGPGGARTFLWGFEASGAAALALYVAGAWFFTESLLMPYLDLGIGPVSRTIGPNWPVVYIPLRYSLAVVMLALPQITFALLGGFLISKFKPQALDRPPSWRPPR